MPFWRVNEPYFQQICTKKSGKNVGRPGVVIPGVVVSRVVVLKPGVSYPFEMLNLQLSCYMTPEVTVLYFSKSLEQMGQ